MEVAPVSGIAVAGEAADRVEAAAVAADPRQQRALVNLPQAPRHRVPHLQPITAEHRRHVAKRA